MQKWQKDMWAALSGSDPREMKIVMAGRQIGKSVMAQMWNELQEERPYSKIIDKSIVDNKTYYTVQCNKQASDWIRGQPGEHTDWYQHIDHNWIVDRTRFDVSEDFYMMLKLRFG